MNNSQRVILNTLFLYANMVVNICVQLVAVRLLLRAFGLVDYGLYNLVAGVVALFAFMNIAMSAATQRFLSYEIGRGDGERIKETFYNSLLLHLGIGLVAVLALEAGGSYYVGHLLQAPTDRIPAALILMHCITASTFVNIITVPYEADINANENMGVIAGLNILDSLMKLAIAVYVSYTEGDRLIIYGVLTMCSLIAILIAKRIYCLTHYPESHVRFHRIRDRRQMKHIASYAAWNFFGTGSGVARYQGTAMILNQAFGIVINAAYGVAQQVNGLIMFFANTIVRAMRPQIVKSEGAGHRSRMLRLSATASKITSLMVALIAVPLFIEIPCVLRLWLGKDVGSDCIMFCRSFLVIAFINQLTIGLQMAIESTGRIRILQTMVGSMHLIALPLGYVAFQMGLPPVSIMLCIVAEELLAIFVRTLIARRQTGINGQQFLWGNVLPVTALVCADALACLLIRSVTTNDWVSISLVTAVSTLLLCALSYQFLLTEEEKESVKGFLRLTYPFLRSTKNVSS